MIKKKLKLKKLLMVLGLATFGLSLGNAGFCQDPWHPKFKYAVVTFDDGLPPMAFNKILPMLFQNCDVDGNGTATDPASCRTNDRVMNQDGSLVEFTYFTTNGMNEFFNNIDYWYSQGNEIANHTVTHGTGWGTQPGVKIFSKERWTQEITDNVKIIKNWTSIDPKTAVTGFRAPFLVINNDTFTGLDDALARDGKVYYDSDIAYELKNTNNNLLPPVKLDNKMCKDWPYSPLPRRIDCDTLIPEDGFNNTLWELPIPAFLGCGGEKVGCSAMVLPQDSYLEKSFADVETLNNENVPLLISIHTAVITKQFQEWVRSMAASGKLTFVRAREVINMYANPEHTEPSERVTGRIWCEPTLAVGTEAASLCKAANSWAASNVDDHTKPQCSVLCNNKNYGSNCEIRQGTPGNGPAGLGFNTCNKINNHCNPNTIPDDYRKGGYPWLGNPQGNSTPGNKCGYLPQITGGN